MSTQEFITYLESHGIPHIVENRIPIIIAEPGKYRETIEEWDQTIQTLGYRSSWGVRQSGSGGKKPEEGKN